MISILMPVKNTSKFLAECIDSIIGQSENNWELIAIDDHSTDDSYEILLRYQSNDPRIKIYKNNSHGIINALRLAYSFSTGEYITRMDSDDIMVSNKLDILKNNLIHSGIGHLSIGGVKYFNELGLGAGYKKYEEWLNGLTSNGSNWTEIYKECVIPSPCWMVHRSDLDLVQAFEPDIYPEDYDLCFRFYELGLKCIPCTVLLHLWRDYSDRTSRTHNHYSDNTFLDLKCRYFLKLHYDMRRPLFLQGAGKKGKKIAKYLINEEVPFSWISNNEKKIGHEVYGKLIQDEKHLDMTRDFLMIVAIANPKEQRNLKGKLIETNKHALEDYFFFC